MTKQEEPGLRMTILNEDGEVNVDLTEALAKFIPDGKKLGIEISPELVVKIATAAVKQFVQPTSDVTFKTDGVAMNQVDFSDGEPRFECEIFMVPK